MSLEKRKSLSLLSYLHALLQVLAMHLQQPIHLLKTIKKGQSNILSYLSIVQFLHLLFLLELLRSLLHCVSRSLDLSILSDLRTLAQSRVLLRVRLAVVVAGNTLKKNGVRATGHAHLLLRGLWDPLGS